MLTRTATLGPELSIVRDFIDSGIRPSKGDTAVSVFCEPLLESGYPDVVVVHWSRRCAEAWPARRAALTSRDMRFLHYIHGAQRLSRDEAKRNAAAIDRLSDAGMIRVSQRWIRCRPLSQIFAVRRIIAIEAKVSNWRQGLRQAFVNTWFASESFLLLPRVPPRSRAAADAAAHLGVGLVASDQKLTSPHVRPRRGPLPQSYASWLFNEWAWQGYGRAA